MTTTTPSVLHRFETLFGPALRGTVQQLDPHLRHVVGYHLGWWAVDGTAANGNGGKAIRPTLALLSAEAAGAPASVALPGAVAVELVHNFSLLHDDLMDGDTMRRHRSTVWSVFTPSDAILAGDALLNLAYSALLNAGPCGPAAAHLLAQCTHELITGQVDDIDFERRTDVALTECITMAQRKTGALLSCAAAIGAVLAGAAPPLVDRLAAYGRHVGLAFQLVDDVLGIWGDPSVTGKPVLSDLRARKKSLPVVAANVRGGAGSAALQTVLTAPDGADEDALLAAADFIERSGARNWAHDTAASELATAIAELDAASMPDVVRADFAELARFVVARQA